MSAHPIRSILILSDGIRGHLTQSRGVAHWLEGLLAPEVSREGLVRELEVPSLGGMDSCRAKWGLRCLLQGGRRKARDWLASAGGDGLARSTSAFLRERGDGGIPAPGGSGLLILSAGSRAAPYNLALGVLFGGCSVTLMTPSLFGVDPFDFAIVPEHDHPPRRPNVLATVGAPNAIVPEELSREGEALLERFPPQGERRWAVLLGGDDRNYRISSRWVMKEMGLLLRRAEAYRADLYVTTSRRTSPAAEAATERLLKGHPLVRMLVVASKTPENPVPGMLGACWRTFCTEDSVSMVSEAATAGHRVTLLRVERTVGFRSHLCAFAQKAAQMRLLSPARVFGPPRFEGLFDALKREGRLEEWERVKRELPLAYGAKNRTERIPLEDPPPPSGEFNEAKRAAAWLVESLAGRGEFSGRGARRSPAPEGEGVRR